nr:hypothetical protein [uncultured organism]
MVNLSLLVVSVYQSYLSLDKAKLGDIIVDESRHAISSQLEYWELAVS